MLYNDSTIIGTHNNYTGILHGSLYPRLETFHILRMPAPKGYFKGSASAVMRNSSCMVGSCPLWSNSTRGCTNGVIIELGIRVKDSNLRLENGYDGACCLND